MDKCSFFIESIILAHRFYAQPYWVSYEYIKERPRHGLVYVLDGSADYEMSDGTVFSVARDDILFLPEGTLYLTRCHDEGFLHMTVNFKMSGNMTLPLRRRCADTESTKRDMSRLVSEWTGRQQCYRERCMGMLYLLLCYQLDYTQGSLTPAAAEKIRAAVRMLEADTGQLPSVSALASACGMSEAYFRRLFIQVYGVSPQTYITQRRIGYACDLLHSTGISVEQVCFASGYQDPAYFCRIFKKVMGVSPSVYRQQLER